MLIPVLFANPSAQSGRAQEWIQLARRAMSRAGLGDRFCATEPDGRTVELVRRAIDVDGARRVICMGGDGTFAEVAKGVLMSQHSADTAVGILPMGTANDQGKSFGLRSGPDALDENVRVIKDGRVICIDVGKFQRLDEAGTVLQGDLFFDSASIGFGAAVLATRNRDRDNVASIPLVREIYRDRLVYAGAILQNALKTYATSMKFSLEVEVDGVTMVYRRLLDVIIKNTQVFGGEWVLDPTASADDGLFEMIPITGRLDLTTKLVSTLRNSPLNEETLRQLGIDHDKPKVGKRFTLRVTGLGAARPPAVQLDGEEFTAGTHFRVEVLAAALPVIVPGEVAAVSTTAWRTPEPA